MSRRGRSCLYGSFCALGTDSVQGTGSVCLNFVFCEVGRPTPFS